MNLWQVFNTGDVVATDEMLGIIVTVDSTGQLFRIYKRCPGNCVIHRSDAFEHLSSFFSQTTDPKGAARDWIQASKGDL